MSLSTDPKRRARNRHADSVIRVLCPILLTIWWWRRRESNPRPKARRRGTLHACPLLGSRARREEAAKNRRTPDPVNLTPGRRAAVRKPACLMASDPQPPGEVRADVTA